MQDDHLWKVAREGDELTTLQALRDTLAESIGVETGTAKAQLIRQLTLVLSRITELKPPDVKGTPLDELAHRRAARESESPGSVVAPRRTDRGG